LVKIILSAKPTKNTRSKEKWRKIADAKSQASNVKWKIAVTILKTTAVTQVVSR